MSLFFNYEVASDESDAPVALSWCEADSILAVSYASKQIKFYQAAGELLPDTVSKSSTPVCLSWKPASKILAIGWSDGIVSLWNHTERMSREDAFIHRSAITFLQWSPDGSRLVSGDESGTVGVWKTDPRGRLISICNYRKKGKFTHCVLMTQHICQGRLIRKKFKPMNAN